MKKILLLLYLYLVIGTQLTHAQKGFYGALGLNLNLSYVTPQNDYGVSNAELDYGFEMGYGGNVRLGYNWHEMLGVGAEIGYLSGGQQYRDRIKLGQGQPRLQHDKLVRLSYITFTPLFRISPLLEKNMYKEEHKMKFVLAFGPQIAVLTGAKVEYQIDGEETPYPLPGISDYSPVSEDKNLFQKFSLNFLIDIGFDWYINDRLYLNPSFRGQVSITDLNEEEYRNHDNYDASHLFMGGLQVAVGYFFNRR